MVLTARGRGAASGIQLDQPMVHALTFRDEQLIRFRWYRDLDEAREAREAGIL